LNLGKEFTSKAINAYFDQKDIQKIEARASHLKAAVAERFIRTIKNRIYKYFSQVLNYKL
jgi:hypothetical protein